MTSCCPAGIPAQCHEPPSPTPVAAHARQKQAALEEQQCQCHWSRGERWQAPNGTANGTVGTQHFIITLCKLLTLLQLALPSQGGTVCQPDATETTGRDLSSPSHCKLSGSHSPYIPAPITIWILTGSKYVCTCVAGGRGW